jgi:hypothetical protein
VVSKKGSEPFYLKNPPQGSAPGYPAYEIITVDGITEIIEHRKMEPLFYVTDDPAVWKELMGVQHSSPPQTVVILAASPELAHR